MNIFTEPDATKYPDNFQSTPCPGLEALTGADLVISQIPIPPTVNLPLHIMNHSLFVQIKIGYDIASFDQLHKACARIQECKIPKQQAILLPIGEYWQDENDLLRLKGQRAFGNVKYDALGTVYDMWEFRGGTVEAMPPKSIDDLQSWIDRKVKSIEKVNTEGKRDIYPERVQFQPDDIWQQVEEVKDWRSFLVSGLDGFGSKKANAIFEYADKHLPVDKFSAYHILCIMTDEDDNSKSMHKIPLWGDKSRKDFRAFLGIPDGWNLSQLAYRLAFWQGWRAFGFEFRELVVEKKKPVKEVHQMLMDKCKSLEDINNQIPF